MKPGTKVGLALTGMPVLMVIGFYVVVNLHGKAVLEETFARVSSDPGPKGFRSHDEFIPPDEENFYRAPILACLSDFRLDPDVTSDIWNRVQFDRPDEVENLERISLPSVPHERYGYSPRSFLNADELRDKGVEKELIVWAAFFRSASEYSVEDVTLLPSKQVLAAMNSLLGSELAELAKAAQRPHSFCPTLALGENELWPGEFSATFLHLDPILKFLTLRLVASFHAGESEVFRETWMIYRKIIEGEMRALNASGLLVGLARFSPLTGAVSMGIEGDMFTREDLIFFYRELSELPFSKMAEGSFAEEIGFSRATFESFKKRRLRSREIFRGGRPDGLLSHLVQIAPDGWIDLNAASSVRWTHEEGVLPWRSLDFQGLRDLKVRFPSTNSLETILASDSWFPYERLSTGLAETYVKKELAQLACLLEIFAIDHGAYPEELSELIPEYLSELPKDPFSGDSMKYFPEENGYKLYSVGMNLRDDFGYAVRNGRGRVEIENGDWVWGEGNEISPDLEVKRDMAVYRIQLEKERGEILTDEAFSEAWARHAGDIREPADPLAEEARRQRLIQKARAKIKQDIATPRP